MSLLAKYMMGVKFLKETKALSERSTILAASASFWKSMSVLNEAFHIVSIVKFLRTLR